MPKAIFRSQRKGEKDSAFSIMETKATWELSMAWRAMPESLQSKLQSWTRSLIASTTYRENQLMFTNPETGSYLLQQVGLL